MIASMGEPRTETSSKKEDKKPARVYVYGGGVAGMTAAHELAIRGFEVHLYERQEALGPQGMMELPSVGGLRPHPVLRARREAEALLPRGEGSRGGAARAPGRGGRGAP